MSPGTGTTVFAGLRDQLGAARIDHEAGCLLTEPLPDGVQRAVAAAERAELVIMVLGTSSIRHYADAFAGNGAAELSRGPVTATSGEGVDVAEVALPAAQQDLGPAVARTGKPTISVIISGRPLGLGPVHRAQPRRVVVRLSRTGRRAGSARAAVDHQVASVMGPA